MTSKVLEFREEPHLNDPHWIPEGEYQLKLIGHETAIQFKTPRLILNFIVCDLGDYWQTKLSRYYYVERLMGSPRNRGTFVAKPRGDFMIEYCNLFPGRVRRDRISMEPLYESIIIARVQTVRTNCQGKLLPEQLQYSKVAELLRISR